MVHAVDETVRAVSSRDPIPDRAAVASQERARGYRDRDPAGAGVRHRASSDDGWGAAGYRDGDADAGAAAGARCRHWFGGARDWGGADSRARAAGPKYH